MRKVSVTQVRLVPGVGEYRSDHDTIVSVTVGVVGGQQEGSQYSRVGN